MLCIRNSNGDVEQLSLVINPGKVYCGKLKRRLFINIEYNANENGKKELSLHGVVGPLKSGNCYGSAGQCQDELLRLSEYSGGWTKEKCNMLYFVWERYHLNGLKAGTPLQEAFLWEWKKTHVYTYKAASLALEKAGLNPDATHNNYKYGSAWLYERIPPHVLEFLASLPETKVKPAWI